jgi:hypothetical protein
MTLATFFNLRDGLPQSPIAKNLTESDPSPEAAAAVELDGGGGG